MLKASGSHEDDLQWPLLCTRLCSHWKYQLHLKIGLFDCLDHEFLQSKESPHLADLPSKLLPFQAELVGGPLPENLKELALERHDRLRVEYQEVLWQFQVPEIPLETEQGETKVTAWERDGDGRFEYGTGSR